MQALFQRRGSTPSVCQGHRQNCQGHRQNIQGKGAVASGLCRAIMFSSGLPLTSRKRVSGGTMRRVEADGTRVLRDRCSKTVVESRKPGTSAKLPIHLSWRIYAEPGGLLRAVSSKTSRCSWAGRSNQPPGQTRLVNPNEMVALRRGET